MSRFRVPAGNPNPPRRLVNARQPLTGLMELLNSADGVATITPRDQLAKYYGGRFGVDDAIIDANMAAQANTADPRDVSFRDLFPSPNLRGINDDLDVQLADAPLVEDPLFGQQVVDPLVNVDEDGFIDSGLGEGTPAPAGMNPSILVNDTPPDMPRPVDELDPNNDAWLRNTVEQGITDYMSGDPGMLNERRGMPLVDSERVSDYLSEARILRPEASLSSRSNEGAGTPTPMWPEDQNAADIVARATSPAEIDRSVAQIRRTMGDGSPALPFDLAEQLMDEATGKSLDTARMARDGVAYPADALDAIDPRSGLPLRSLVGLQLLSPANRERAIKRMTELLGVGGMAAGVGMGQRDNGQGINPRSTMGPLGGLME